MPKSRLTRLSAGLGDPEGKSPTNMFQPMKISDGSMKKLGLYTITPMPKLDTYARR